MNEDMKEKLSAYIDGALSGAERAAVEQALAGDAELRRELEGLRAVSSALKSLPREPLPPGFRARLEARLGSENKKVYFILPPQYRPVAFALSSAALALMVWDRQRPVELASPEAGWLGDRVPVKSLRDAPPTQADLSGKLSALGSGAEAFNAPAAAPANKEDKARRALAKGAPLAYAPNQPREAFAPAAAAPEAANVAGGGAGADELSARTERERSDFNERMYQRLEGQKKKMGIARVLEKDERAEARKNAAREKDEENEGREIVALEATPSPAPARLLGSRAAAVHGSAMGALGKRQNAPFIAAEPSSIAVPSGRADAPAPAARVLLLKSAAALEAAWAAAGLPGRPPAIRFPSQQALFLSGPPGCGIVSARVGSKYLTVLYKGSGFDTPSARVSAIPPTAKPILLKLAK